MTNEKLLSELNVGEYAEIVEIRGGRGIKSRLRALGVGEGQRVKKLSKVGFGGPVIILVNRAQVAIGQGMARHIIVGNSASDKTHHDRGERAFRPGKLRRRLKRHQRRRIHNHVKEGLEGSNDG